MACSQRVADAIRAYYTDLERACRDYAGDCAAALEAMQSESAAVANLAMTGRFGPECQALRAEEADKTSCLKDRAKTPAILCADHFSQAAYQASVQEVEASYAQELEQAPAEEEDPSLRCLRDAQFNQEHAQDICAFNQPGVTAQQAVQMRENPAGAASTHDANAFEDFLDTAKSVGKIAFPDDKYLSVAPCPTTDDKCLPMSPAWVAGGLSRLKVTQDKNKQLFYRAYAEQGISKAVVDIALAALAIENEHTSSSSSGGSGTPDPVLPSVLKDGLAGRRKVEGGEILPSNHPLNSPLFSNNAEVCDPNIIDKAEEFVRFWRSLFQKVGAAKNQRTAEDIQKHCEQLPTLQTFLLRLTADLEGKQLTVTGNRLTTSQGRDSLLSKESIQNCQKLVQDERKRLERSAQLTTTANAALTKRLSQCNELQRERMACERLRDDLEALEGKFLELCTVAVDDQQRLTAGPRKGVDPNAASSTLPPEDQWDAIFNQVAKDYLGELDNKFYNYIDRTAKSVPQCDVQSARALARSLWPEAKATSLAYLKADSTPPATLAELQAECLRLLKIRAEEILNKIELNFQPCYPCIPDWNLDLPQTGAELCREDNALHIGQTIALGSIIRFQGYARITKAMLEQMRETIENKREVVSNRIRKDLVLKFGYKSNSQAYKAASKAIVRESSECLDSLIGMKVTSEEQVGRLLDECMDGSAEIALSSVLKEKP